MGKMGREGKRKKFVRAKDAKKKKKPMNWVALSICFLRRYFYLLSKTEEEKTEEEKTEEEKTLLCLENGRTDGLTD